MNNLVERIKQRVRDISLPVCGADCMAKQQVMEIIDDEVSKEPQGKRFTITVKTDEILDKALDRALDEFTYKGKTIREWAEFITNEQAEKSAKYQQIQQWIPCSERLPEDEVIACDDYENIMTGYVFEDEGSNTGYSTESDNCKMYDTVAWMPLPEPWKGQVNE